MEYKSCPECGAPEIATGEHIWLNNGDIVHKRAPSSRMIFLESENLDPVFHGIEQIIGVPIEHMIITTNRRAQCVYLGSFVPDKVLEKIRNREMDYEAVDVIFRDLGRIDGLGDYNLVERRYEQDEEDFDTVSIAEPHCVPMAVAAHVGAIEVLTGVDQGYRYEVVSPNVYHVTAYPSPHPEELSKRLWFQPYEHQDGDIELERCATCGGPKALSGYQWYTDRGVILNKTTRRRTTIMGDALLHPIFSELEEELGDEIPRAVVEAQRRFTKSGFYTIEDITGEADFRTQLALRGLGNLEELRMRQQGMHMRVANVVLPLILVGMFQGFFEMSFDLRSSNVEWLVSEKGDLEMEATPSLKSS
jgi:hypothetical protein